MKIIVHRIILLLLMIVPLGCTSHADKEAREEAADGWKKKSQVLKVIRNVHFNFPAEGYAFDNKDDLVGQCFEAMEKDRLLIGLPEFSDTIQIRFLASRDDMYWLTRSSASGMTYTHLNTLYVVADGVKSPPIRHELMHLIAMLKWGYPHPSSTWLNEGLASYAENNCNGFTVAQVYRFFMEKDMLIPFDSLAADFYAHPEMVAYHQSAYVVEYLLKNHPVDRFHALWTQGFDAFEAIYGLPFSDLKAGLEKALTETYPQAPDIDWETFKAGCM